MFEKEEDRVCSICSTHLRGRESRITAGKGSRERKLEELDSDAKNYEASGILPSKRVSFSQLRSPYSKCLPSVFFNRSPLFLPVDSQPRLWGDRSFHVVTAVISTDYILVRDLLLQRFHPIRGHVVSNLGTETARFSSRFVNEWIERGGRGRGRCVDFQAGNGREKDFPPSSKCKYFRANSIIPG